MLSDVWGMEIKDDPCWNLPGPGLAAEQTGVIVKVVQ